MQLQEIAQQAKEATLELLEVAKLKRGDILVVGCSTSEVTGHKIGTFSSTEVAQELFLAIHGICKQRGIFLAAQCCEHLNRAIIIEQQVAEQYRLPEVNVLPQPKAGGSFATAAYAEFESPVAVETIQAHAGLDIGGTLIGMQLRPVAVPVRLKLDSIGQARIIAARTRPKFIGGERAHYNIEKL